ncbi:hypothetical protein JRQ81_017106, partial [Phrynocephalus forsythii]
PCCQAGLRVIVCGHSYVFWATKYAWHSAWIQKLSLGKHSLLDWKGLQGLAWDGFSDLVSQSACEASIDVLLVHLGGNDLARVPDKALILIADLKRFKRQFQDTQVIWPIIIPHLRWHSAKNSNWMEHACKCVNREVDQVMINGLGSVVNHPEISP